MYIRHAQCYDSPTELRQVLLIPRPSVSPGTAKLLRLLLDCEVCANLLAVSDIPGILLLLGRVSGNLAAESGLSLSTEASW